MAGYAGRRIEAVDVHDSQSLRDTTPDALSAMITGRYLREPQRRGKFLVLPTAPSPRSNTELPCLLVHFGMTGTFISCSRDTDLHRHDRVVLSFRGAGDEHLRYRDMRKLTGIRLAAHQSDLDAVLDELGPDALTLSPAEYRAQLTRTRRQIKPALMDQSTIAGLGNLCVDEILWRSRIHPKRSTTDLDNRQLATLHERTRSMLTEASRIGRVPDRTSWLTGHRYEPSGHCPRYGNALRRDKIAGRTTAWCPRCQQS